MNHLKYFILFFVVVSINVFSQNEANNWYFGDNAGVSFNDGLVTTLSNGSMSTPAGCASISNNNGDLLFYTNGQTVWNKNHVIMDNGTNLPGDPNNIQSSIIVPKPSDPNTYYIFSTRAVNGISPLYSVGFYLSEVHFTAQNPLGIVVSKSQRIMTLPISGVTGIHYADANTIKVITFGPEKSNEPNNTFYIFDVTDTGVNRTPTAIKQDKVLQSVGTIKTSPNGKKIAIGDYSGNYIYLFDFDVTTNTTTYSSIINPNDLFTPRYPYGIEFSPDSNILYFTAATGNNVSSLFKYLLNNTDDITNDRIFLAGSASFNYGSLQLATNGKIYAATFVPGNPINTVASLSVLNNPNDEEGNSGYEQLSLNLSPNASFKGLPNFITSFLRNRIITENTCYIWPFSFKTDTYANLDSILWEFGDGNTSTEFEPTHTYSASGTYMVKATITFNNQTNTIFKEVEAYELPIINPNEVLLECDTDNDGNVLVNLKNIETKVLNPNRDFDFFFFHTEADALNDTNPIPNPESYTATLTNTPREELFVKIVTPFGCYTISNFFIEAIYIELENIAPMFTCEFSDSRLDNDEGRFDLTYKIEEIKTQFNLAATSTVKFYRSLADAQTRTNPLWVIYDTKTSPLWVRAETENNECAGIGSFNLIVNPSIELNIDKTYTICPLQPKVTLNGGSSNDFWEWQNEDGVIISTNQTIDITQAGNYSVTAYKEVNNLMCSITKKFTIVEPVSVTFKDVVSGDYQIQISVTGNSTYTFSIDGITYEGEGKNYTFYNVSPGIYNVYVKDLNNCELPISTETAFIGFPKYFSPNGDGFNDIWKIEGISENFYLSADIYIFDRYGKALHYMDLITNQNGWNGTFNGQLLSASDYWFNATLTDSDNNTFVKTGHFSLKF